MFKRQVLSLDEVVRRALRENGIETQLKQKRLIDSWGAVAGEMADRYTAEKFIKNQTLFVKITNPALRHNLSMMRAQLVGRLNAASGGFIITDIHIY